MQTSLGCNAKSEDVMMSWEPTDTLQQLADWAEFLVFFAGPPHKPHKWHAVFGQPVLAV